MFKFRSIVFLSLILSLVFVPVAMAQTSGNATGVSIETKIVKAIEVKGNKTISIATILAKIKTRVGQEYIQSVISDDLKRLYNTGYFSDVRVDREDLDGGFKVVLYIEEKSIIEEITFSKTRVIKPAVLSKKLKSQVGKFLDKKSLKDDVDTIEELYAKKGLTSATVEVETFVDEITNKVSLHFIVREGHKVRIKRINIYGNDSFPDKRVHKVIKSRARAWWFIIPGYLKQEELDIDMERIASFYEKEGFIDASATYTIDYLFKGQIDINIQIDEGRRYFVGEINVVGQSVVSEKEIFKTMKEINEGGVFSREKLSLDISNIRTLYFDRGYIFASIDESTILDPETGEVGITLSIQEGGLAYIEKVEIQGNSRTKDVVIRRELKLFPGDRFDGGKLRRSKERLNNLGYFEDVSFDIEDTDASDRKDLVVQVKEAKTGSFSFGGGFSTVDKVVGFVQVEQRNFDWKNWPTFTGAGQHLSLRAETGTTRNNINLSFTEPWLLGHPVSGGFDFYISDREREEDIGYAYDEERLGGVLRFGKRFTEYISGGVSYKYEVVDINNFEPGVSADLLAEGGENNVSQLSFTASRDTRDSRFSPTKGLVVSQGFDVAGGFLGGDKDFYRTESRVAYYIPFQWNSVLELRARGGIVNDFDDTSKVPIFERFFVGGANSIRGYEERKVGPLDSATQDPIGGEALLVANIEYTIPVVQFVKLAAFIDTGNVWAEVDDFGSGDLKTGTGLGLRIKTPIGPVSLDYGYPLNDEPGEDGRSGKFYFNISRGF